MSDEPDEALLSVRRYWADRSERQGFSEIAEAYRSGKSDKSLQQEARAYRAGQAASAERIKALEHDLMWTDRAWEAAQEAVVYGYTLMDKQDERIKALEHIAGTAQLRANDHGEQLLDAYGRIKALEEVTQNLIALLDCDDREVSLAAWDEALDEARNLLKEADR